MKSFILFLLLILFTACSQAQTLNETDIEDDTWYLIYTSAKCSLYVKFEFPSKGQTCKGASSTKFYYRYKGLESDEAYAIWELDYLDCGGITKKMTAYAPLSEKCENWGNYDPGEEFNYQPSDEYVTAKKIIELRGLNTARNDYMSPIRVPHTVKESFEADRLTTSRKTVRLGEKFVFTIEGGSLGIDADWVIFDGKCGGDEIHRTKERNIEILPKTSTTIYVRAEGKNNVTNCKILEITVDKSSTPPSNIDGNTQICLGSTVSLTQKGGVLGPESDWYWYSDNCGGNMIATGSNLEVQPDKTTTFYIRSQSKDGSEKGNCVEKTVYVFPKPSDDFEIINKTGKNTICEGEEILLKADGELEENCEWIWTNTNNNRVVSKETELKIKPNRRTTYKLTKVSKGTVCPPSENAKFLEIDVYNLSQAPTDLYQKFDQNKKNQSQLILEGGELAKKSKWLYYFKNNNNEVIKAKETTDESIEVEKGWYGKYFYVKAVGPECNDSTQSISTKKILTKSVNNPIVSSGFALNYTNAKTNFLHFDIQAGLQYFSFNDSMSNNNLVSDVRPIRLESMAYYFGGEFHPIFLDQFYLGVHGGYGEFFDDYYNFSLRDSDITVKGKGILSFMGAEMGWTISRQNAAKMFLKYTRTSYNNNLNVKFFESDDITGNIIQKEFINTQNIVLDRISLGFRFGAFDSRGNTGKNGNPKLGQHFDIAFNLHYKYNYLPNNLFADFSSFTNIGDWKFSYEMQYWVHNVLRIGLQMGSNTGFNSSSNEILDYFVINLAYNFDLFW